MYDLDRFITAQEHSYKQAFSEGENITMQDRLWSALEWSDFFDFYKDRVNHPSPITQSFVLDPRYDYQQKNDRYIENAIMCGLIISRTREERNRILQSWHFFVSYLYIHKHKLDIEALKNEKGQDRQIKYVIEYLETEEGVWEKLKSSKSCFLPCVELTLWMAETAGVFEDIEQDKVNEMLRVLKRNKKEGKDARKNWTETNKEVFNKERFIEIAICDKVWENKDYDNK